MLTPPANVATHPPPADLKRRLIAASLSAVVPGAGQLNLGKRRKALVIFAFGLVTVAKGKYFVRGDKLDMSLDSRTPSFGLVDEDAIVGKALYSYQFTGTQLSRRLDGGR
jgi:Signal peptidase, peptidase S26